MGEVHHTTTTGTTDMNAPTSLTTTSSEQRQIALIRKTMCPGLTNDEFELFCAVAKAKELSILQRQIHAVKRWSAAQQCEVMTIQTSIDGYRLIAQRHGLAGIDDGVPKGQVLIDGTKDSYAPESITITVYRRCPKTGERDPYTATATWRAYYPEDKKSRFMWQRRPREQLEKCAEALALRRGFQEVSGIYTTDEMQQADGERPGTTIDVEPEAPRPEPARQSQNKWSDEQHYKIRALKDELGLGWDAMCSKVFGYTIDGQPPTREQATLLISWLEAERKERAEGAGQ